MTALTTLVLALHRDINSIEDLRLVHLRIHGQQQMGLLQVPLRLVRNLRSSCPLQEGLRKHRLHITFDSAAPVLCPAVLK